MNGSRLLSHGSGKNGDGKMKESLVFLAVGVLIVFLTAGCTGYGKLRPLAHQGRGMTIEALEKDWQGHTVYWAGLNVNEPSGLMFDPKGDERALTGDHWMKVKDKKALSDMIDWLQTNHDFYPFLLRILGPDNQLYGYMYTGWRQVVIKPVDDRTLWVGDMPGRLQRKGGDDD